MDSRTRRIVIALGSVGVICAFAGLLFGISALAAVGLGTLCLGLVSALSVKALVVPETTPANRTLPPPRLAPDRVPQPESADIHDTVLAVARAGAFAGPVAASHLWLEDPATGTMRLAAAVGDPRPSVEPAPIDNTIVGEALSGSRVIRSLEVPGSHGEEQPVRLWRFALCVSASEARGVAAIDFTAEPDAEVLDAVMDASMCWLSSSLALYVARGEALATRALVESTRDIARLVDPDAVAATALKHAMRLSSAHTGSVMLLDEQRTGLRIVASRGLPDSVVEHTVVVEGEGIAGWVLATGEGMVVEDIEDRGPRGRRHGVRSAMVVPIVDADGVMGVLSVGSAQFHAKFSRTQLDTLESIGRITAVALRNAHATQGSQALCLDTLKALSMALETKDPYTNGATGRVLELTEALAAHLGIADEDRESLAAAALLHDIGMSAAGDGVSSQGGPLSTIEWAMLKMHPVIAAEILESIPSLRGVIPIVYHHHEHFDGQGYVSGLSGETIPLGARVLAVSDAYTAMTSPRPYRPAMTRAEALDEMRRMAGSQFDPEVVAALEAVLSADLVPALDQTA